MALTPKQEKYVQGLVAGLSQREAYKQAYDASRMKDNTIDRKAYDLFHNGKVRARYEEFMTEHKDKALWTREQAINDLIWLKEQARKSIENQDEGYIRQGTSNAYVNAIQELNKLEDIYPDKDQSITLNGAVSFIDDIS